MKRALVSSIFMLILSYPLAADPVVQQFFPASRTLLGKPVFWIIKVRYPLWEDYVLKTQPCPGLKMEVSARQVLEEAGELAVWYRIRIVPQDLAISGVPSVALVDQKGQATVLNGKPVKISLISGSSLDIKQPGVPSFSSQSKRRTSWLLLLLAAVMIPILLIFRSRSRTPKAVLLPNLKRAQGEIRKGHLPFGLWKMLRSELLWGFTADSWTASQLAEYATGRDPFVQIARMLESIERMRYSGQKELRPLPAFEQTVGAAIEAVKTNRSKRK